MLKEYTFISSPECLKDEDSWKMVSPKTPKTSETSDAKKAKLKTINFPHFYWNSAV